MLRVILAGLILFAIVASARADTLVLKDGRQYTGDVVKNSRGYSVYVAGRQIMVPADDVQSWIKGDARRISQPSRPSRAFPIPFMAVRKKAIPARWLPLKSAGRRHWRRGNIGWRETHFSIFS